MSDPTPRLSPTAFAVKVLGVVPHAKQAEFLECRAKVKVAACGRRFGKTTAMAIDALWYAVTRPGTTQLLVAPTHDQAKILWTMARSFCEQSGLAGLLTEAVESPFPELRLAVRDQTGKEGESAIMARSVGTDARNVRGHGADRLIVDEAAFISDLVLSQTLPPIIAASPYGEMVLLSTPFGTSGTFYQTFQRGLRGEEGVQAFHFPSSCNPAISPDYLDRQRQEMPELAWRTEYLAEFCSDMAAVFRPEVIQAAIDAAICPGAEPGHRYTIGFDPARYADRSGVCVLDVTERPYRAVEILDIAGRDYLVQAAAVKGLVNRYGHARVLVDGTGHDQMVSQLKADGVRADSYRFTNESKRELIDGLVIALEKGDLKIPRHDQLIRELTYYRYATTAGGTVTLGAPDGPGHFDDLVTALALALKARRRGGYLDTYVLFTGEAERKGWTELIL